MYLQSLTDFTPVVGSSGPSNSAYTTVSFGIVTLTMLTGILSL
jgi:hypothetical protein